MVGILLVACSNNGNNEPNHLNDPTNNEAEQTDGTNENGEVVTVKIASWGFGTEEDKNLNRLMVDAFNELHDDIKVEIDESIDPSDWNGSLSAAASASAMPDVFMLAQIPTGIANDWLLDITELANNDDEFSKVPDSVVEAVTHDGEIIALPAGQHLLGYFVNKDLFDEANLDAPEMGISID